MAVGARPTSSGSVKCARYGLSLRTEFVVMFNPFQQRESSATIMAPPISYQQSSPPKTQKVIDFDCRGLEFIEFKPEVCNLSYVCIRLALT